ncbi:MAG: Plexin repeat family protein [Berkelbacteria bacterium GW2011_GWB1_38_5]|nr:MAG: Plexin repeat family protein [Berkelbacteria bacterium GW2011_GWB1_38_5]
MNQDDRQPTDVASDQTTSKDDADVTVADEEVGDTEETDEETEEEGTEPKAEVDEEEEEDADINADKDTDNKEGNTE